MVIIPIVKTESAIVQHSLSTSCSATVHKSKVLESAPTVSVFFVPVVGVPVVGASVGANVGLSTGTLVGEPGKGVGSGEGAKIGLA